MYYVREIEDVHPFFIAGVLKTIKDIKKIAKEKNGKEEVKELDFSQQFDQAHERIEKIEEAERRNREERYNRWQEEKKRNTEEVAKMFQDRNIAILKKMKSKNSQETFTISDVGGFMDYGTPKNIKCKLDDEKLVVVYDFSDEYHSADKYKTLWSFYGVLPISPLKDNFIPHWPRNFAFLKDISWEYLEELLAEQNIIISHEKEEKEEPLPLNDSFVPIPGILEEDSLVTIKEIITVTALRPKYKDKAPVITEEPQKVKTKRKSMFSNLLNKKTK